MVRTIITPTNTDLHLTISEEYVGKKIEITYLALEEIAQKPLVKKKLSDLAGTLSHETSEEMLKTIEDNRNEWEERLKKQFKD